MCGHVFDVENFECENASTVELVRKLRGCDATAALSVEPHAAYLSRVVEKCVGLYADQIYSHKCTVSVRYFVYKNTYKFLVYGPLCSQPNLKFADLCSLVALLSVKRCSAFPVTL